jgi:hypothetical protein
MKKRLLGILAFLALVALAALLDLDAPGKVRVDAAKPDRFPQRETRDPASFTRERPALPPPPPTRIRGSR